jgi:hypothetical protein
MVDVEPQPTAAVRFKRPMKSVDVGALMDRAMGSLGARLGGAGVAPDCPPSPTPRRVRSVVRSCPVGASR